MQEYGSEERYNPRRRRNLDLGGRRNTISEQVTGIQWDREKVSFPDDSYIESGCEDAEEEDPTPSSSSQLQTVGQVQVSPPHVAAPSLSIDGKPIRFQARGKGKSFEETHVRFTSFLDRDLDAIIKALKKQGHIRSITELINESIKHYLTCKDAK